MLGRWWWTFGLKFSCNSRMLFWVAIPKHVFFSVWSGVPKYILFILKILDSLIKGFINHAARGPTRNRRGFLLRQHVCRKRRENPWKRPRAMTGTVWWPRVKDVHTRIWEASNELLIFRGLSSFWWTKGDRAKRAKRQKPSAAIGRWCPSFAFQDGQAMTRGWTCLGAAKCCKSVDELDRTIMANRFWCFLVQNHRKHIVSCVHHIP